jgi:hypothetical protein
MSGDSFNLDFVDLKLLPGYVGGDETETPTTDLNQTVNDSKIKIDAELYDESTKNNKFNSFPMRQKKLSASEGNTNPKLKPAPRSASSIQQPRSGAHSTDAQYITLTQEELALTVRMTRTRRQEADRLKHLIRNNCWPASHPIRKYLWTCLLESSSSSGNSTANKENHGSHRQEDSHASSEVEYNKHLNQIFGKCKQNLQLNKKSSYKTGEIYSKKIKVSYFVEVKKGPVF